MSKINLFIANAGNVFTSKETAIIKKAAAAAEDFIAANFTLDYTVDIVVTIPSYGMQTTPEDGISARTHTSQFIIMVLNPQQSPITEAVVFETLCHEMSHSLRWKKLPEYANTLLENIILEGLAVVLEEKAIHDTGRKNQQFFLDEMQNTSNDTIDAIVDELSNHFASNTYDYECLFYTGSNTLPRWAGYRLGYYLVKKYLKETDSSIIDATLASYRDFEKILIK